MQINEIEYQHMVAVERELIEIRVLLTEIAQLLRKQQENQCNNSTRNGD